MRIARDTLAARWEMENTPMGLVVVVGRKSLEASFCQRTYYTRRVRLRQRQF